MNACIRAHDGVHLKGDSATHPIEPHWRTRAGLQAVLLSQGTEALACARHKQSSGLFVFGLGLASAPHRSPLGSVQLRFLVWAAEGLRTAHPKFDLSESRRSDSFERAKGSDP